MPRATMLLVTLAFAIQAIGAEQDLLSLYKHLHANPELSFQEVNTSALVAEELDAIGFEVTRGVGGDGIRRSLEEGGAMLNDNVGAHGVVAVMRNGEGPVLMLRTDMDALPVNEQTGLPYASTARGRELTGQDVAVMHACGHDMHMAVVIGAARVLARQKQSWSGTLLVIAQPAEERGAGARMLLDDGLFERFPRPDYNLGVHGLPTLQAGMVGYVSGWMMANVDSVDITVHGIGAHGAYPQAGKDPVVLAAAIIMDLQTLVSREIHPLDPAVVTVGSIHAGTKHNIISDRADLQLTVRSYSDEVRAKLLAGIERIATNQGRVFGLPEDRLPEVRIGDEFTPALWNDPALVERSAAAFRRELGDDKVVEVSRVMGGEDFSRYGRVEPKIPSFMIRLGTISQEKSDAAQRGELQLPSLHSPFFYPEPELTIDTGVRALSAAALDLLQ